MDKDNRTGIFGLGFAGILLTAWLAGQRVPSQIVEQPPSEQTRSDTVRRTPLAITARPYRRGEQLIREYLAVDRLEVPVAPDSATLGVLIATIPDPYDSHLDQTYDLNLEALRRAFEDAGYVLDRFWLPGRNDSTLFLPDSTKLATREVYPGVILFRRSDTPPGAPPALHLLYLIGELPTGGIHKQAMRTALDERERLLGSNADTIRIVGPVFSGSSRSLREAIDRFVAPTSQVRIVSGSASDPQNGRILRSANVEYAATVHDDEVLLQVIRTEVLQRLGRRRVALLRESATGYGQSVGRTISADLRAQQKGPPRPDSTATESAHGNGRSFTLNIPFPLNIASLRSEYAANPLAQAQSPQSAVPVRRENERLPLQLNATARPRETPPVTSALTAPTLDLVVEELMRLLRSREIEAVGILATDIRDKLFLAEVIRRRLPDVLLFTFESNTLYRRSDFAESLHGMVIASTYPMITENQRWVNGARPRDTDQVVAFGNEAAEGIYNAAATLLGQPRLEYGPPLGRPSYAKPPVWITAVGANAFAPLAVCLPEMPDTLALQRTITPNCAAFTSTGQSGAEPLDAFSISFLAWAFAFGIGLVVIVCAFDAHDWFRRRGSSQIEKVREAHDRGPIERGTLLVQAELYIALRLIAVLGMFLPVASVIGLGSDAFHGHGIANWRGGVMLSAYLVGIVLAALAFTYTAAALRRAFRYGIAYAPVTRAYVKGEQPAVPQIEKPPFRQRVLGLRNIHRAATPAGEEARLEWNRRTAWFFEIVGRFLLVFSMLLYLVVTLAYVVQVIRLGGEDDMRFVQFFHRTVQIDSGLSPLLPLIIAGAGFAAWCSWHIKRVRLMLEPTVFELAVRGRATGEALAPALRPLAATRRELEKRADNVSNRLILLVPGVRGLTLLIVLVLVFGWLIIQFETTLETVGMQTTGFRSAFDLLFFGCMICTLAATTWAVYRLLSIWQGLSDCLDAIADTPLLSSFERLPRRLITFGKPTLIRGASREAVLLTAQMQWRHLHRIYHTKRAAIEQVVQDDPRLSRMQTAECLEDVMSNPEWHRDELSAISTAALQRMGTRLRQLHTVLEDLWEVEPTEAEIDAQINATSKTEAGGKPSERNTSDDFRRRFTGEVGVWMRVAEEFVAVQAANYVEWVQQHLRILSLFLLLSLLLTTALISSYPFQPESLVRILFVFILISAIAAILHVTTAMNRNEVLSKINHTTPGAIAWNASFVSNIALYVVLPLLTLLSSQFPRLREVLFAWTDPLLKSITKL